MSTADVVAAFDAYDAAVVENAIPWLALQAGLDIATAPPPLQSAMLRFAERAGLKQGMSPPDVQAAVDGWYRQHPLPAELIKALAAVARQLTAEGSQGTDGERAAAARLLGDSASRLPVGSQPVPEGAMKNSPLARFQNAPTKKT